ncbi:HU family DNA-binding protein [Culicoidibacter larvae]|uniref:HU family DNA-binding protein n=1 Tax=Culicoidibacter larvae TaxID=2579976 RepID=A0A5R8QAN6_9FIRM|nr:HU family DNA-binding protein [Culicoidibacter larvae]TLG72976.1 HU family DNA-binding protein [Culicoidibacter larvae]
MLTKKDLVAAVAEQTGSSKKDAEEFVNAFVATVKNTLKKGEKVSLTGFGTFEVRDRAARSGRNPKTGEPLQIAASKVPAFKAGKELKEAVK